MKIAIAGFALESVSFLPFLTEKSAFDQAACRGQEMLSILRHTETVGGGFLDILEGEDIDVLPLVYVDCSAGGPASDDAFEAYRDEILVGIKAHLLELEGVLLYLHGAMTTPSRLDPETDLLKDVRAIIGPDMPLSVAFDLHANLSLQTQDLCASFCGFHYSPHTDMAETGRRSAKLLMGQIRKTVQPVIAMAKLPIILPSIFTATSIEPLAGLVQFGEEMVATHKSILDVSLFCGFAYADVPDIGFSIAVMGDGDQDAADRILALIESKIRDCAEDLYHIDAVIPLEQAISTARDLKDRFSKPVVLLEHADRFNDSSWILRAILEEGADLNVIVPYLWDPKAVEACVAAGVGNRISLEIGGWTSVKAGGAVKVEAEILWLGHKMYIGTGPMRLGRMVDLGEAVVLKIGNLIAIVTSLSVTAIDEDCFVQFGFELSEFDIILLRSKTHFRAAYEEKTNILMVDTPDWGTADLSSLPYRQIDAASFV